MGNGVVFCIILHIEFSKLLIRKRMRPEKVTRVFLVLIGVVALSVARIGVVGSLSAQTNALPFEKWTKDELQAARNEGIAEKDNYHDTLEKSVIFYTNLVRINPRLFAQTYLLAYLKNAPIEPSSKNVNSLKVTLNGMVPLNALTPAENLHRMAKDHAVKSGKSGEVGHAHFEQRLGKFTKSDYAFSGENCAYGVNEAFIIFMQLLIDDGVESLGHRKNLLNKDFKKIGVSQQPHKKYRWNCVMEFGG